MKNVVVVGGGIAGLSAVHTLRKVLPSAVQIHLVEAANRLGGLVGTTRDDKYLFEVGPRGFRPSKNGAEIVSLVEQLSLQDECIESMGHNRFVFTNGRVEQVPGTPLEFLRWSLAPDIIKAVLNEVTTPKSNASDESIYDFVSRRFSPRIADALLDPMASGIFAGNIKHLSVRSCFGLLYEKEQMHGSVVRSMLFHSTPPALTMADGSLKTPFVQAKGKAMSLSFRNGMQTLIDALSTRIADMPNTHVQLNTSLTSIANASSEKVRVALATKDGTSSEILADHVFSAIPARHLKPALAASAPTAARAMGEIPFASVAIVTLGYRSNVLPHRGFGHLVPTCEKQNIIGVIYDSCSFPQQQDDEHLTRLSVFVGGENHKSLMANLSLSEMQDVARQSVEAHLGITEAPEYIASTWYEDAIPQYPVGFHALVERIETDLAANVPRLTLLGNSFYGVGLADAVHRSTVATTAFAKTFAFE
ncbi:protoporphyrinogen oxidase [Saprolegnia parasitica CBS 223.65]|uniref:Protoporphyrinogen oxidase n=1 Tax=Saprolegnia parasitica (strain CBS 223.65) TaxID=695850 RepID=A0A067CC36_SAPPC|nr:protoporphyrinogen oxidase [Saprolegnia parasitica CBS 223.65]KDO28319.1 protoporphyrinogen oxidase [Saprolegnia parasitica CBS 223.65]|eukprot:XP_012201138.1 protoporphyrinogen oxidase [Saprolegnia parasitica CBS 223.65]